MTEKHSSETENTNAAAFEGGSVSIAEGRAALAERLELCTLRSASFEPEKQDPAWADFLGKCLQILKAKARGKELKAAAEHRTEYADAYEETAENSSLEKCRNSEKAVHLLQNFWLQELLLLPSPGRTSDRNTDANTIANRGASADRDLPALNLLVTAWETTLQILLESECSRAEKLPVSEKEIRDILYSYFYDYAEELLEAATGQNAVGSAEKTADHSASGKYSSPQLRFLPAFLSGKQTAHVQEGLSLFFGDRLKAKLLEILERREDLRSMYEAETASEKKEAELKADSPAETSFLQNKENGGADVLTAHQKKALAEFRDKRSVLKRTGLLTVMLLLALTLTACGGSKEETADAEENATEVTADPEEAYPGTVAYEDAEEEISDRFGIMHATVLDVQEGEKDGLYIYTLRDEEDPDNVWCLNSQDIGSVIAEMASGKKVAVLFSGDIVNDPESVEFIAILNDASYNIKQAEGSTISNMMNSFTIRTTKGVELSFAKDNCKVDRDALSTENGARLLIIYTEGGGSEHYPLRVYKLKQAER